MPKIKKMLLMQIPMSICNFRCHYCYLSQRPISYQGKQLQMLFTPKEIAYALRPERIGGFAFMNFCADGETLLTKD
jgi:sulfatase maturation enzyme AslB (radical SAM superfamily)